MLEEFIFFIFVSNPTMRKGRSQTFFVFFVFVFFVFFVFFFFFFERKRGKLRSFQVSFQLTQKEVGVVETNSFESSRRYSFRRVPSNVALLQNAILRRRRNVSIRGLEWRSDAHDSLVRAIRIRIFIASFIHDHASRTYFVHSFSLGEFEISQRLEGGF